MTTIYQAADAAMRTEIRRYLQFAEKTNGLVEVQLEALGDKNTRRMYASGLGIHLAPDEDVSAERLIAEGERKAAVPFDIERSVTLGVYEQIRPPADQFYEEASELTRGFTKFDSEDLFANPHLLPVLQHLAGIFSKANLKKEVGSVSDTGFSKPASIRLAELLEQRVNATKITKDNILQRMEATLEGIVRDLVGRVLLEEVVAEALKKEKVPFLREEEYSSLSGVVYDFRADFVIPNNQNPIAFIEVRKSSSRHASLYAKDKMFSAINWKGKHRGLIGVIVVDGDWTQATLSTMAKVFDYVVPLHKSPYLAQTLARACNGDDTVQKWLLNFSIEENPSYQG